MYPVGNISDYSDKKQKTIKTRNKKIEFEFELILNPNNPIHYFMSNPPKGVLHKNND